MNKRLFVLLPIALLTLVGCNKDKDESKSGEESSQTSDTPDASKFGTLENPLTIAQAKAVLLEVRAETDSSVYTENKFFIKAPCRGNTAKTESGDYQFVNLQEDSQDWTCMYTLLDNAISETYTAKDCFKNKTLTVSGYAMWYEKSGKYTPELVKTKIDGTNVKPMIHAVE